MKKKKIISFEEFLKSYDKKTQQKEKYRNILKEATGDENEEENFDRLNAKQGKFSIKTKIKNSPWVKTSIPSSKAISWLYKTCFKQPEKYRYNKILLSQGNMFTFEYKNPKLKNTSKLPWFDKYPLVISLGPVVTNEGIRNLGINLHLLPPKIRIVVVCIIFDLYKKIYRYKIFNKKSGPVAIKYKFILKSLEKYGIDFAVRMYIPQRIKQIVVFPFNEWDKSVFIPSRGYDSIKASKLIQLWRKHIRKKGISLNHNLNWKSHV